MRDYAWHRAIGDNGLGAMLLWLLTIEVIGLLALPLTPWLFARFPDRGWGLSKRFGWLLFAYPIWLLASLRLGQFTLPYLLITLGGGAILAGLAVFRWRDHYLATLRTARPMIILSELVFLAAGGFFLFLRIPRPRSLAQFLWRRETDGTGAPQRDSAECQLPALRSVVRRRHDSLMHHYGQYLVATLVKLTGIPVEIAFNLGLAFVGGLIGATAFSVAGALAALALRCRARRGTIAAFSLLGSLLFIGIGNLDATARLIGRLRDGGGPPSASTTSSGAAAARSTGRSPNLPTSRTSTPISTPMPSPCH